MIVLINIVKLVSLVRVEFPVKRRLLRPCIALTAVVQAGRGKYQASATTTTKDDSSSSNNSGGGGGGGGGGGRSHSCDIIPVDVDACTFDRVLLYLEHEAREELFKFDPLIAPELLEAAETLNILGLQEACQKVLGSFKVK